MALSGLFCADVPLRNHLLSQRNRLNFGLCECRDFRFKYIFFIISLKGLQDHAYNSVAGYRAACD